MAAADLRNGSPVSPHSPVEFAVKIDNNPPPSLGSLTARALRFINDGDDSLKDCDSAMFIGKAVGLPTNLMDFSVDS